MPLSRGDKTYGAFPRNEFGHPEIPSRCLTQAMVPSSRADWQAIAAFALTYDAYTRRRGFDRCANIANEARERYRMQGRLPRSLADLRTCLFFEQRRFRHFAEDPIGDDLAYIRKLVAAIRKMLKATHEGTRGGGRV